jgi:hypothetical protein
VLVLFHKKIRPALRRFLGGEKKIRAYPL